MHLTLRPFKIAALVLGTLAAAPLTASAEPPQRHHGLSLIGEPKFGADFKNFDWVNPEAPKGGTLHLNDLGTFDNLNGFAVNGNSAEGLGLINDTLMISSPDEPSTEYGLIAEWVSYPPDYSSVTFGLRKEARFHDGTPITADDVIFSLEALKKSDPFYDQYYKNVVKVEKTGDHEVTFTFDSKGNRELPQIMGQLSIVPKHYWEAKGADGEQRSLSKTTLEPPLGSGPYRIKSFEAGRNIVYERVKDYWAKDLPVLVGQFNYDEIRYEYYRDRVPAFEAFKNGQIDYWPETSASTWTSEYNFDAVRRGLVKKEAIPHKRVAGMQGFAFNLRRKQLQDPRVRRAFNLAFDFESANRNLFNGQYVRAESYFGNSELQAKGLPQGKELEILNEVKADVPPEVFTTEWKNPVNAKPEDFRQHLREAFKLLNEAGWTQKNGVLTNAAGEPFRVEFLLVQPDFVRIVDPYIQSLRKLGIQATVRVVDSTQYLRRINTFDFDIIVYSIPQSSSPGNEQRNFWSSAAADRQGSRNVMGIKNPAIDKLIDRIVFAKDREELVAATHALDRVLLWNWYVVPQWYYPYDRLAYWDIFGRPDKVPSQSVSPLRTWWIDPARLKAVQEARGRGER
jgi:microcin C transport system substrate-binding protein